MSAAPPAVVLFSGGLDSSTCLSIARADGFAPHALAVRYGQRHAFELVAARAVADALQIPLRVVEVDLRAIGGSALTANLAVPKDGPLGPAAGIPVTYVPARNTVLLALALGRRSDGITSLFFGATVCAAIDPAASHDLALQLSLLGILGLGKFL
ncbi:MAG: hypothetical protein NVS4B10_03340 [Myxococcales bacterium]